MTYVHVIKRSVCSTVLCVKFKGKRVMHCCTTGMTFSVVQLLVEQSLQMHSKSDQVLVSIAVRSGHMCFDTQCLTAKESVHAHRNFV